ncbi:MAG: RuBisCO large subunit C-terminal-like domain-containing protein [Proteobacteria bacterium]|nr:RuBisCO large subunit C-terminal-like domain-containing protein [Pseudomonadota bacterium]
MSAEELFVSRDFTHSIAKATNGFVFVTYSFPALDKEKARATAVQIASGQTLGYVPESLEQYKFHIARVVEVAPIEIDGRWSAVIAFPGHLFGPDISGILTVVFGKISFSPGIRLEMMTCDETYLGNLKGPKIGFSGIKNLLGVSDASPLLMAILKPGLGISDAKLAEHYTELVESGTHLVKDDEVRVDLKIEDALKRLEAILNRSSGKGMYVMALNGPAFELRHRALTLQSAGAKAFLVCPYTYGVSVFQSLCSDNDIKVPIFAHPALTGALDALQSGIASRVTLGVLMRWAGADAVLFPSPYGSIALPVKECQAIHESLMSPLPRLLTTASVPSAGIMPHMVSQLKADFGSQIVVNAGTGMARSGNSLSEGVLKFKNEIKNNF